MRHIREILKAFIIKTPFWDNYPTKIQKNQLQNNILPSKATKLYFIYLPIGTISFLSECVKLFIDKNRDFSAVFLHFCYALHK